MDASFRSSFCWCPTYKKQAEATHFPRIRSPLRMDLKDLVVFLPKRGHKGYRRGDQSPCSRSGEGKPVGLQKVSIGKQVFQSLLFSVGLLVFPRSNLSHGPKRSSPSISGSRRGVLQPPFGFPAKAGGSFFFKVDPQAEFDFHLGFPARKHTQALV